MRRRAAGFSLLEPLVAAAVLALLAGLTLAAVQRVRESAARAETRNRLRQIVVAVHHFADGAGRLPEPPVWRSLGPQMLQRDLLAELDPDRCQKSRRS